VENTNILPSAEIFNPSLKPDGPCLIKYGVTGQSSENRIKSVPYKVSLDNGT